MSSLNTALSIASGSLQAVQTQLSTASSNVSNASSARAASRPPAFTCWAAACAGVFQTSLPAPMGR